MTERARIEEFLGCKRIALVGASTHAEDFSRVMMKELAGRGIDVVPVHPTAESIAGRKAYARVSLIPERVEGALIMTPPSASAAVVEDCAAAGVGRVWLHRGVGRGAVSDEAIAAAEKHGLSLVEGRCPLMFLGEPPAAIHRMHADLLKLSGRYPDSHRSRAVPILWAALAIAICFAILVWWGPIAAAITPTFAFVVWAAMRLTRGRAGRLPRPRPR